MNRTIKNWAEIINEDSLTSNDVIDMLKDFYSVDMSYCIGTEIEESMQTIYDFIHSEKNRNLIARAFRCKPEEISTVSVSIGNMADLEKYKVIFGSLNVDGLCAGDTGKVKFVSDSVFFEFANPNQVNIETICGDVHFFKHDETDISSISYIGGRVYTQNQKIREECKRRFGKTFEDEYELV